MNTAIRVIRKGLVLASLLALLPVLRAQPPVGSPEFQDRLEGLLSHSVPETGIPQAAKMDQAVFLDARAPEEYAVSHIENALWVGYDSFDTDRVAALPRDTPLVVYCSVGYRSERIAEKLIRAGYTRVSNLYGGIFEWVNQGYPVADNQGPTRRVHTYNRQWSRWLLQGIKVY